MINIPNVSLLGLTIFKWKPWILSNQYYISGIVYCSNAIFSRLFRYTFITLNYGITWDLYKSVRNPFDSYNTRHDLILLFSPTMFLLSWIYWFFHWLFNMKTDAEDPICGDLRFDLMFAPGEICI